MVLLRWPGKKPTKRGQTILEISLALFLGGILLLSFFSVYKSRVAKKELRNCEERKWIWLKASQEIEYQIRKWEMAAQKCLWAGFNPLKAKSSNQIFLRSLSSHQPLLRPVKFPMILEIPAIHQFYSGDPILVCDENHFREGKISRTHPPEGNHLSTLEVKWEEENNPIMFHVNSVVVSWKEVSYEISSDDLPGDQALFSRLEGQRKRRLTGGFEKMDFVPSYEPSERKLDIRMSFVRKNCLLENFISLQARNLSQIGGNWLLGEKQLMFQPWEKKEGGVP